MRKKVDLVLAITALSGVVLAGFGVRLIELSYQGVCFVVSILLAAKAVMWAIVDLSKDSSKDKYRGYFSKRTTLMNFFVENHFYARAQGHDTDSDTHQSDL